MTVETIISPVTLPLKPYDTAEQALDLMVEFRVRHLPIVSSTKKLLGVVSEDQLLDAADFATTVDSLIVGTPLTVDMGMHAYDVAKLMIARDLTTVPVLDENQHYAGLVERRELFDFFVDVLAIPHEGAVLVLELDPRDYSVAQIVHDVEQNGGIVLSFGTVFLPSGRARITFKLNIADTARIRHVLEHHGYRVVAAFQNSVNEEMQERIEAFMRYLEV